MVIQQNMARNSFFYHASASTPLANHSDFFNTHAILRQLSSPDADRVRQFTFPMASASLASD